MKFRKPELWDSIAQSIVNYEHSSFCEIFRDPQPVVAITGPAGVGKSTFLLWMVACAIDENFAKRAKAKPWFKKAAFLNVRALGEREFEPGTELLRLNPAETLLVVDGIFRLGDDEATKHRKAERLRDLVQGVYAVDAKAKRFRVAFTARSEEYRVVSDWWPGIAQPQLRWDTVPLWRVFECRLQAWGIKFKPGACRNMENRIRSIASEPIYLELLASDLAGRKVTTFTPSILSDQPIGMINLVWQILKRNCEEYDDDPVLSLIQLLVQGIKLSDAALQSSLKLLCKKSDLAKARKELAAFCGYHLHCEPAANHALNLYSLTPHWRNALSMSVQDSGMVNSEYHDVLARYRALDAERTREALRAGLLGHLESGILSTRQAAVVADLIRLDSLSSAKRATELWLSGRSSASSFGNVPSVEDVDVSVYTTWLGLGRELMGDAFHQAQAREAFEMAFSVSRIFRADLRRTLEKPGLKTYLSFLRNDVLPSCTDEEYRTLFSHIDELYERFIGLDDKDKQAYKSRANFYLEEGEFEKAREWYERILALPEQDALSELISLGSYARFLSKWSTYLYGGEARICAGSARAAFDQALDFAQSIDRNDHRMKQLKDRGDWQDWQWNEHRIRREYASLCQEEIDEIDDMSKRRSFARLANRLLEDSYNADPEDPFAVGTYANFLCRCGYFLAPEAQDRYRSKARGFILHYIRRMRQQQEPVHPFVLKTTAHALYLRHSSRPAFWRASVLLQAAILGTRNDFELAKLRQDLGELFGRWARSFRRSNPVVFQQRLGQAERFLALPERVQPNRRTAEFFYKLHRERAKVARLQGRPEEAASEMDLRARLFPLQRPRIISAAPRLSSDPSQRRAHAKADIADLRKRFNEDTSSPQAAVDYAAGLSRGGEYSRANQILRIAHRHWKEAVRMGTAAETWSGHNFLGWLAWHKAIAQGGLYKQTNNRRHQRNQQLYFVASSQLQNRKERVYRRMLISEVSWERPTRITADFQRWVKSLDDEAVRSVSLAEICQILDGVHPALAKDLKTYYWEASITARFCATFYYLHSKLAYQAISPAEEFRRIGEALRKMGAAELAVECWINAVRLRPLEAWVQQLEELVPNVSLAWRKFGLNMSLKGDQLENLLRSKIASPAEMVRRGVLLEVRREYAEALSAYKKISFNLHSEPGTTKMSMSEYRILADGLLIRGDLISAGNIYALQRSCSRGIRRIEERLLAILGHLCHHVGQELQLRGKPLAAEPKADRMSY